jgi:hypothetical protein
MNKHSFQHIQPLFISFAVDVFYRCPINSEKICDQICCCTSDFRFARPGCPSLCGGNGKATHDGKAAHDGRPSPLSSPLPSHDETGNEADVMTKQKGAEAAPLSL